MYIPVPYFKNVPKMGNLVLDYVIIEDGYPVLFVCKNGKSLYLCLCRALRPEQKWIISEVDRKTLEALASRELSISAAFTAMSTRTCIAKWSKLDPRERYSIFQTSELSASNLPASTLYLNEDDAEDMLDYIQSLKNQEEISNYLKGEKHLSIEISSTYSHSDSIRSSVEYGFSSYPGMFERFSAEVSIDTHCTGNSVSNLCEESKFQAYEWQSTDRECGIAPAA